MLAPTAALTAVPAAALAQQRTGVDDPQAFVAETYARYVAAPNSPPPDPAHAYSQRLRGLFGAYEAWSRQHEDLVGGLDFDWWANAQDYSLSNVALTPREDGPDRRTIIARFRNYERAVEVRFTFVRERGRWFLDDAASGGGADGWTLSALLRQRD